MDAWASAQPSDGLLSATGIRELDEILGGGFTPNRLYLIEGAPGSGKTTLALQCLINAAEAGDPVLYITLSESTHELRAVARTHGWSLHGVSLVELLAEEAELEAENQYQMFQPSELELSVTTKRILAEIEKIRPRLIVIDSLSEMRLLAQSSLRYRRQILALKQYFMGRNCTVFLLDDKTSEVQDLQLQSVAHGVIELQQLAPEYGAERRRLRVTKLRGQGYKGGFHDFKILQGGIQVYPRLSSARLKDMYSNEGVLKSGLPELDALLGGGVEFGTSVLLVGPAGTGKSSFATQYAKAATDTGHAAAVFAFDERRDTFLKRSAALGMDLSGPLNDGALTIRQVDPAELSPGEFAYAVRTAVDEKRAAPVKVVIIDSLNGYLNAMPEERFLNAQLHELLTYLGNRGVITFIIVAQHGVLGDRVATPIDTSYVADAVVLFRFFETHGWVRQAISVVKKRIGRHERTLREYRLGPQGLQVGEPLEAFHGILTGVPQFVGQQSALGSLADE